MKQKKKKKSKKKVESDEEDETDISTKEPKEKITDDEIIYYGQFLTNFGLYNKFLIQPEKKENKKSKKKNEKQKLKKHKKSTEEEEEDEEGEEEEDDEEEEEEEEEEESEEGPKESLEVFLMDAVQNTKSKGKKKSKENTGLNDLINDKILISLMERQNLIEIVKNNIKKDNVQLSLICTWVIEIFLRDSKSSLNNFRLMIRDYSKHLNKELIYQLLLNYGRIEEFIEFASLMGDYQRVILYFGVFGFNSKFFISSLIFLILFLLDFLLL